MIKDKETSFRGRQPFTGLLTGFQLGVVSIGKTTRPGKVGLSGNRKGANGKGAGDNFRHFVTDGLGNVLKHRYALLQRR